MSVFQIALVAILAIFAVIQVMYIFRKAKMHKREEKLLKMGVGPYGSGLSHGMVLNKDGRTVRRDSTKSPAWYSRLV